MNKKDLLKKAKGLGLELNKDDSVHDITEAIKEIEIANSEDAEPKEPQKAKKFEITVNDPKELRPQVLPPVVEVKNGNAVQVAYAKILNSYAYSNPVKWASKKDGLVKKLELLGKHPELFNKFSGKPKEKGQVDYGKVEPPK